MEIPLIYECLHQKYFLCNREIYENVYGENRFHADKNYLNYRPNYEIKNEEHLLCNMVVSFSISLLLIISQSSFNYHILK